MVRRLRKRALDSPESGGRSATTWNIYVSSKPHLDTDFVTCSKSRGWHGRSIIGVSCRSAVKPVRVSQTRQGALKELLHRRRCLLRRTKLRGEGESSKGLELRIITILPCLTALDCGVSTCFKVAAKHWSGVHVTHYPFCNRGNGSPLPKDSVKFYVTPFALAPSFYPGVFGKLFLAPSFLSKLLSPPKFNC
jgi:hypothetical protein